MGYIDFLKLNVQRLFLYGVRDGVIIWIGGWIAGFILGYTGVLDAEFVRSAIAINLMSYLIFAPILIAFRSLKETTIYLPIVIIVLWLCGLINVATGTTDMQIWSLSILLILVMIVVCSLFAIPIRLLLKKWVTTQQTY